MPSNEKEDVTVEIHGYVTDPKWVGYQILTNYESTYWRRLVGHDAWALYEVLRSFCHEGNSTCYPSINLLVAILGLKQRRVITGWVTEVKGKEYQYPGLIETLQQHKLVVAQVKGKGPLMRYIFHVNLTPGVLTDEQLAQLPRVLQKKHAELIKRCEQAVRELETKRRPPKTQKEVKGSDNLSEGSDKLSEGSDNLSPEQQPYNNTHRTTTVVEKLKKWKIDQGKAQELATDFSPEYIEQKIEFLEWKLDPKTKTRGAPVQDPAGWLIRAIQNDWQPPPAFKTEAQRQKEVEEKAREEAEWKQQQQQIRAEEKKRREEKLKTIQEKYATTDQEAATWVRVLEKIEPQIGKSKSLLCLKDSHLLSVQGDGVATVATIAIPNSHVPQWLGSEGQQAICRALAEVLNRPRVHLEFEVL